MLDITAHAVKDSAFLHLKGADGEHMYSNGLAAGIQLYGPGSKKFAEVEARKSARTIKRMQDNDGKFTQAPLEQRQAEAAEDLADLTVGFQNFGYPPAGDAQGIPLYRAVYTDPSLGFINKQIEKFLNDWGNFKPGSAGI